MKTSKYVLSYQISEESVLLINALTGAVDIVDPRVYRFLQAHEPIHVRIDNSTIDRLEKRGYLVESDAAEEARLQYIVSKFADSKRQFLFVICPTYSCNLRCTYCFEGELTRDHSAFMRIEDIDHTFSAIDRFMSAYPKRKCTVELFGGEPLLPKTKPLVKKVFEKTRERSLLLSIVTNGVHLDKFTDILSANKDIIHSIQVTLDGPQEVHDKRRKSASGRGTFEAVNRSISDLLDMGIETTIRINVDLQNINTIPQLFTHMQINGWLAKPNITCNLSPIQDHAQENKYGYLLPEDELVSKIFDLFKKNPGFEKVFHLNMFRTIAHIRSVLSSGKPIQPLFHYCEADNLENIVFGPDGYIYACTEVMGSGRKFAIGKFRPTLKVYDKAIDMWSRRSVLTMKKCRQCNIALLCGGGCAYSALSVNSDINKPVCGRAREVILAYLDYIKNDLAKKACA
ncbi:MAG: SPASM domain-containing protein [Firmicutes bacterium]|nr:SPASM domain-containing protein [Bacillota bacterium]